MKSLFTTPLIVALLICGTACAQDSSGPHFEHMKAYRPMIGTWRYEGPLLEGHSGCREEGV